MLASTSWCLAARRERVRRCPPRNVSASSGWSFEASAGRVPVMAGAGGYDTREVIESVHAMAEAGVDGILSVTPYYNKPTQDGLFEHYKAIATSTSLPIVVYNVPGRTGCNVEPATLARLAAIPNIIGVKEASGNMAQICEVCRSRARRLPRAERRRCDRAACDVGRRARRDLRGVERGTRRARPDDRSRGAKRLGGGARALHTRVLPLMAINFVESNPIPVKAAMARMGLLEERYRLPLVPPRPESRAKVERVLAELGLIDVADGPARRAPTPRKGATTGVRG